jgi:hypothetical protein
MHCELAVSESESVGRYFISFFNFDVVFLYFHFNSVLQKIKMRILQQEEKCGEWRLWRIYRNLLCLPRYNEFSSFCKDFHSMPSPLVRKAKLLRTQHARRKSMRNTRIRHYTIFWMS